MTDAFATPSSSFDALRGRACLVISAILLGACAASPPAPVENRTRAPVTRPAPVVSGGSPAAAPASAGAARIPGPLASAGGGVGVGDVPATSDSGGAQTAPVRPSGVEVRPLGAPPGAASAPGAPAPGGEATVPAAPTAPVRREPRGTKRPYSDKLLAELKAAEAQARAEAAARPADAPASASAPGSTARPSGTSATPATPAPVAAAPAPGAAPAPAPAPAAPAAAGPAEFAWPAKGKVIQGFGDARSTGISIAAAPGDAVSAAADGKVIFSGLGPRGYGNLIIVKHDGDTLSVYGHGRTLLVKEGQQVRKGQKIAEAGDSGTDKPKLLFEIRKGGKPVDPLKLLPAN